MLKVGVYIDNSNILSNGGRLTQYHVLRDFACRDGAVAQRMNAYIAYDPERARRDQIYRDRTTRFHLSLRDQGFKTVIKDFRWYTNAEGEQMAKANADLDMAVDVLTQAQSLDRVLLVTGDGDFVRVVQALQARGCRVEVIGLDNVSLDLRHEADMYLSGYLIPGLLPPVAVVESDDNEEPQQQPVVWGELGSRVRGWCYHHNTTYGFLRFLKRIGPDLHLLDTRLPDSPCENVFFHDTDLPEGESLTLPSRELIFEFTIAQGKRGAQTTQAVDIKLVSRWG